MEYYTCLVSKIAVERQAFLLLFRVVPGSYLGQEIEYSEKCYVVFFFLVSLDKFQDGTKNSVISTLIPYPLKFIIHHLKILLHIN